MAILKISKFNLIVFENDKNDILKNLQEFKEVDFRNISLEDYGYENQNISYVENIDDKIYKLEQTIKKLRNYVKSKGLIKSLKEGKKTFSYTELSNYAKNSNWEKITEEIQNLNVEYEHNLKNIESIKNKVNEYKPYWNLDVNFEQANVLKYTRAYLGVILTKNLDNLKEEFKDLNVYLEIVNQASKESIISLITHLQDDDLVLEILKNNGFNKANIELSKTPKDYIKEYEKETQRLLQANVEIENKLKMYAENVEKLEVSYEYYQNEKLKELASEKFGKTNNLIVIQGYIPSEKENEFEKYIKQVSDKYYYLFMEKAADDSLDVPIKLRNGKFFESFEDLVKTYSMPKYNEIDPTPLVAPFYWLFFGMMVADFGYGLIMAISTFFILKSFKLKESMAKMVRFFFFLSISIMMWGIIYGSYFSLPLPIPSLLNPAVDYNKILAISIVIGIIHVFVGLGAKAYVLVRDKKPLDAFYDVGLWYILLSTVILVLSASFIGINPFIKKVLIYLMVASMIGIILTGGREIEGKAGRIGLGIYSLYGISGYIGDFISYARLMALGLSGGFIAQSVNQICAMIGFKPLTIVFVIIIFLLGQTFNMLLSLLSAYVHSARLIYVEFFGKFYEGGGKEFKDFKIEEKYINIKEEKK